MELYKVTLSYKDILGEKEWEKDLEHWLKSNPKTAIKLFDIPKPESKKWTKYVAVFPDKTEKMLQAAAILAGISVVGPRSEWEKWQVHIENIEHIGNVATSHEYDT